MNLQEKLANALRLLKEEFCRELGLDLNEAIGGVFAKVNEALSQYEKEKLK